MDGTLVGMAYVTVRRNGRFEIRESLHTPRGPRARSLASFATLTDEVLAKAATRATRPFDAGAVVASARRAHAPVALVSREATRARAPVAVVSREATRARAPVATGIGADAGQGDRRASRRFVEASQRMASSLAPRGQMAARRRDPGDALIELLGFADAVTRSQPARPFAPLAFPAIARLAACRRS